MNLAGVHPRIIKLIQQLEVLETQSPAQAWMLEKLLLEAFEIMGDMAALGRSTATFLEAYGEAKTRTLITPSSTEAPDEQQAPDDDGTDEGSAG